MKVEGAGAGETREGGHGSAGLLVQQEAGILPGRQGRGSWLGRQGHQAHSRGRPGRDQPRQRGGRTPAHAVRALSSALWGRQEGSYVSPRLPGTPFFFSSTFFRTISGLQKNGQEHRVCARAILRRTFLAQAVRLLTAKDITAMHYYNLSSHLLLISTVLTARSVQFQDPMQDTPLHLVLLSP